jgi:hypothetical protein
MLTIANNLPEHAVRVSLLPSDVSWIEQGAGGLGSKHAPGAAAEYACALFYNLKIYKPDSLRGARALAGGIEVKNAAGSDPRVWNLVVPEDHLRDDRVYVLALTHEYPKAIYILGAASGHRIRSEGTIKRHATGGHEIVVLSYRKLSEPLKVFDYLRSKLGPCHDVSEMFSGPAISRK